MTDGFLLDARAVAGEQPHRLTHGERLVTGLSFQPLCLDPYVPDCVFYGGHWAEVTRLRAERRDTTAVPDTRGVVLSEV